MSEPTWIGSVSTSVTLLPSTIDACRNLLRYSRESSDRILGIYGQDYDIFDWAHANGFEIVGSARDNEVNGQLPATKRPGLSAVIKAIAKGKADGVVFARFDRLARDFPTQDDALRRIWAAGGRVFTVDPDREWLPDKPWDPEWRARRDYADEAEKERRALVARLQAGRRRLEARGGYGGGPRFQRRFGDLSVEKRQPIPAEQAVIKRICAACPDGKGYAAMARTLNEEGVPTVTGAPWSRKVVRSLARRGPAQIVGLPVPMDAPLPAIEWTTRRRAAG